MTYQVLARKWRPRTFSELIGQEHVVRALVNALDQDRIHHAFLFTGTRGVGKTTLARVFAKALNCLEGVSSQPCGQCTSCKGIDEGRFFDLIEVDAASRTKVDDTRELLDNVQYLPTNARYKVYLIDEVHMLSTSSFNALLKTLEEPPEHVKFLLATTDPQKLPLTVLSRCLQFNLKRLGIDQIADYLALLAERESFEAEAAALRLLAVSADGSMRDALSLLDQAVAYGAGLVKLDDVQTMLGTVHGQQLGALVAALCDADGAGLWTAIRDMVAYAPDYGRVLGELAQRLHQAALVQAIGDAVPAADDLVAQIAVSLSPADVQLYYQIAISGRGDLDLAPDHQTGFEMTLLRMLAFQRAGDAEAGVDAEASAAPAAPSSGTPAAAANAESSGVSAREAARRAAYGGANAENAAARPPAKPPAKPPTRAAADTTGSPAPAQPSAPPDPPPSSATDEGASGPTEPPAAVSEPAAAATHGRAAGDSDPLPQSTESSSANTATVAEPEPAQHADLANAAASPQVTGQAMATDSESPPLAAGRQPAPAAGDGLEDLPVQAGPQSERAGDAAAGGASTDPEPTTAAQRPARSWEDIIDSLGLRGTAAVLASNSLLTREDAGSYVLALDPSLEHLHTQQAENTIKKALGRLFGTKMQLRFALRSNDEETPAARLEREQSNRQKAAQQAIETDPLVQTLKDQLGAQIVPGSVRPRDS